MIINAKEEFILEVCEAPSSLKCAIISFGDREDDEKFVLPVGYTNDEYQAFLSSIDRNYDSGYGCQELFGTIWFENGDWSERGEYDGSEWWAYKATPEIPSDCIR